MNILLRITTDANLPHDKHSDREMTIQEAAAILQWQLRRIRFVENVEILQPAMPAMDETTPGTQDPATQDQDPRAPHAEAVTERYGFGRPDTGR